jgi:hypothetical protein
MSAQIYNDVTGKAHAFEFLQAREAIEETMDLLATAPLNKNDKAVLEETVKSLVPHSEMQASLSLGRLRIS